MHSFTVLITDEVGQRRSDLSSLLEAGSLKISEQISAQVRTFHVH